MRREWQLKQITLVEAMKCSKTYWGDGYTTVNMQKKLTHVLEKTNCMVHVLDLEAGRKENLYKTLSRDLTRVPWNAVSIRTLCA